MVWFSGFGWCESVTCGFGVGWWRLGVQFLGLVLGWVTVFACFGVWLDSGLWVCEFVAFGFACGGLVFGCWVGFGWCCGWVL